MRIEMAVFKLSRCNRRVIHLQYSSSEYYNCKGFHSICICWIWLLCFMLRWEWERGLESLRSRCWWRKWCNLWKIWKILKNYEKYEIFHKKFLSYLFQLIPPNNNSFATRRSQSKKISSFKTSLKAKKSLVLNF